jgi:tetratricopeptide (TPR) repeat protein
MATRAMQWIAAAALALAGAAHAEPIVPASDSEVVETLPAAAGNRAEERRVKRELAARPLDAKLAAASSQHYLDQARELGDPRFAGQALAALQAWPDAEKAPTEVLLMQATVQQFLHEFDPAAHKLELLLKREPRQAQAWLTLATVRRVQGRYDASDAACAALGRLGAALYATACRAENDGLRGRFDSARPALNTLLATPQLAPATRNWLLTSLAELEARAGRPAEAEAAYRAALSAQADSYTTMSFADFLIGLGRNTDALTQLKGQRRTDAMLLRMAIAGTRSNAPEGAGDAREMRERIALANLRPDAKLFHAREQAMFALWVDQQPQRALALARANVTQQREALDLLVLAQAARASGQTEALRETGKLMNEVGLRDQRIAALL